MTENLNIFLQLLVFVAFFSFPINNQNSRFFFKGFKSNSLYQNLSINIFIHLNLFLLISFLKIDSQKYFIAIITLGSLLLITDLIKKIKKKEFNTDKFFFLIIFLFLIFSIFFDVSENLKLEWDALSHWIYKTKSFYNNYGIKNLGKVSFHEYPHLGTYIWAFFWKNSFLQLEYYGRLFFCFFYVVSIFTLINNIFKNENFFIKLLVVISIILLTYDIFLFSGYQGYLIFSILVLFSNFYFMLLNKNYSKKVNFIFLLLLIFGLHPIIWFKDEGIFYFLIVSISAPFFINISFKKKIFLVSYTFLFPLIQFFLQKNIIGIYGFQADIIHTSLSNLLNLEILFSKLFLITKYILISFVKYKLWIINLISLFLIYFFYKKLFYYLKPWTLMLFFNFGLLYAIYLHTPFDLEFLLKVTLDRLLFQTSGLYLIFPLLLIKKIIKN